MSQGWIKARLQSALKKTKNQNGSSYKNLNKLIDNGPVLAVVMKTVLNGNGPTAIYLQAQSYPSIGPWNSKFK